MHQDLSSHINNLLIEGDENNIVNFVDSYLGDSNPQLEFGVISNKDQKLNNIYKIILSSGYADTQLRPLKNHLSVLTLTTLLGSHSKTIIKYVQDTSKEFYTHKIKFREIEEFNQSFPLQLVHDIYIVPNETEFRTICISLIKDVPNENKLEVINKIVETISRAKRKIQSIENRFFKYKRDWNDNVIQKLEGLLSISKEFAEKVKSSILQPTVEKTFEWNEEKLHLRPKLYEALRGKAFDQETTLTQFENVFSAKPLNSIQQKIKWTDNLVSGYRGTSTLTIFINWIELNKLIAPPSSDNKERSKTYTAIVKNCFANKNGFPIERLTPECKLKGPKHEAFRDALDEIYQDIISQ